MNPHRPRIFLFVSITNIIIYSAHKICFQDHEMSQVPEPPTHIMFFCEHPAEVGGEVCKRLEIIMATSCRAYHGI